MRRVLPFVVLMAGPVAAAGVDVKFRDGAPTDMFHVLNLGCPVFDVVLTFDLRSSASGVVIDTAYGGRGTQDPAEVQIVAGDATLRPPEDGTQMLTLDIPELPTGGGVVVTFDSDDTLSTTHNDRVRVEGHEIAGAIVTIRNDLASATGTFDESGNAALSLPSGLAVCLSS